MTNAPDRYTLRLTDDQRKRLAKVPKGERAQVAGLLRKRLDRALDAWEQRAGK